MNKDEQRGYSKGYAAGQRRQMKAAVRETAERKREDFVQRMMIAVAPSVIAKPWRKMVGEQWKTDTTAAEHMDTARSIAEAAAKRCTFHAEVSLSEREKNHG